MPSQVPKKNIFLVPKNAREFGKTKVTGARILERREGKFFKGVKEEDETFTPRKERFFSRLLG